MRMPTECGKKFCDDVTMNVSVSLSRVRTFTIDVIKCDTSQRFAISYVSET